MTLPKLEIKTVFEFQAAAAPYYFNADNGILICVQSDCICKAARLAIDVDTAMQYGAFPAAHAVMLDNIKTAENEKRALSFTMEFAP